MGTLMQLAMGFLLPISKLIAWTVGRFILLEFAHYKKALEPKIGGFFCDCCNFIFSWTDIFAGFVNMDLGPERGQDYGVWVKAYDK